MKQWSILICTLILLLVAGFGEIHYLNKTSEKLQFDIRILKEHTKSSDFETSQKIYNNLEKKWLECKKRIVVFYRQ